MLLEENNPLWSENLDWVVYFFSIKAHPWVFEVSNIEQTLLGFLWHQCSTRRHCIVEKMHLNFVSFLLSGFHLILWLSCLKDILTWKQLALKIQSVSNSIIMKIILYTQLVKFHKNYILFSLFSQMFSQFTWCVHKEVNINNTYSPQKTINIWKHTKNTGKYWDSEG